MNDDRNDDAPSSGQATADSAKAPYHHGDLRGALLRAAEAELAEKGVEGFTLRGCAKRAGVSHAAPAHHFKDANALLTELAAIAFDRFGAAMRECQDRAGSDPRQRLVGAGIGYIEFARRNPALFRLMFSSSRPDFEADSLKARSYRAFAILMESVEALRRVDPRQDAAAMRDVVAAWATAHGLADLLLADRIRFLPSISGGEPETVLRQILNQSVPEKPD